jgi:hypothetical protein
VLSVEFAEPNPEDARKLIYARSAYRHEPDFEANRIQRAGALFDAPRSRRMIESESKVSDNYGRMVSATVDAIYSGNYDATTVGVLRDMNIGRIRSAMLELFPDLELQGPGDPVGGGTFYFKKSNKPQFHYKNLSGGEKAAFDLILDLVIKTVAYDDTVFCIDEPELHLNTRLQAALLRTLLKLIPPNGQLWIATHSIGMLREAQRLYGQNAAEVAFLDFEGHNFDEAVTLTPVIPDRAFWTRTFNVALGDLADLVAPDCVVVCEGRPASEGVAPGRAEFDARCYRTIFADELPTTDFISVGNSSDVQQDRVELGKAIQTLVQGTRVIRLVDRDMRTQQEIDALIKSGVRVLRRRHIESYLLADDVLQALCEREGKPERLSEAVAARDKALADGPARGKDPDDVKSAAGLVYNALRMLLGLVGAGTDSSAFLSDTMAPLVKTGMPVYAELREDIFGS